MCVCVLDVYENPRENTYEDARENFIIIRGFILWMLWLLNRGWTVHIERIGAMTCIRSVWTLRGKINWRVRMYRPTWENNIKMGQFRWQCGQRRKSAAPWHMRSWVLAPLFRLLCLLCVVRVAASATSWWLVRRNSTGCVFVCEI